MSIIQTASGRYLDLLNPDPDAICIKDIAASLSKQCRFNGHTKNFYSVAQHSVHVAQLVRESGADDSQVKSALLHDAAEAYTGDIVYPLKSLLAEIRPIEKRIHDAICTRFQIPCGISETVKYADLVMLATERRDLMTEQDRHWPVIENIPAYKKPILWCSGERAAEKDFLVFCAEMGIV